MTKMGKTKLDVFAVKIPASLPVYLFADLIASIAHEKETRIRELVRESDQLRTLFGDLLIRSLVKEKINLINHEVIFGLNEYNKPYLIGVPDFHFNISHAGEWVVAAIDSLPVGIDIERIRQVDMDVSKNVFSDEEHYDLVVHAQRNDYFFTLWALKESYIKMLGMGTRFPLQDFYIKCLGETQIFLQVKGEPNDDICFRMYNIDENYKMALCANHNIMPVDVRIIDLDTLIQEFINY